VRRVTARNKYTLKLTSSFLLDPRQVLDNTGMDPRRVNTDTYMYKCPALKAMLPPGVAFSTDQWTTSFHAAYVLAVVRVPDTQHVVGQQWYVQRTTVL